MRFYEAHPTDGMRSNALEHQPPWREVIASLTREPRRRQEVAEADGDGDAPALPDPRRELALAHRDNQEAVTRLRVEHDDDVRRFGPNPLSSRPISGEAERLRDGLRRMDAGAKEILKVADMEPMITLAQLIAELFPNSVRRQLREVHHAYSAVHLALKLSEPIDVPVPSDAVTVETDPDADIEALPPLPFDDEGEDR
jgi:hypothetical protein